MKRRSIGRNKGTNYLWKWQPSTRTTIQVDNIRLLSNWKDLKYSGLILLIPSVSEPSSSVRHEWLFQNLFVATFSEWTMIAFFLGLLTEVPFSRYFTISSTCVKMDNITGQIGHEDAWHEVPTNSVEQTASHIPSPFPFLSYRGGGGGGAEWVHGLSTEFVSVFMWLRKAEHKRNMSTRRRKSPLMPMPFLYKSYT